MRRKIINALFIGMIIISLCSCGKQENENVTETTDVITADFVTEAEIRNLLDENLNCMSNIFILDTLPTKDTPIQGQEGIYQVEEDIFGDYAEFESYVRSVYCKETADMYLYDYPNEENPKYVNIEGKLCTNRHDAGKGYCVDWTDYALTIESVQDGECQFTVACSVEPIVEESVSKRYMIQGKAVYENDRWLLTDMLR